MLTYTINVVVISIPSREVCVISKSSLSETTQHPFVNKTSFSFLNFNTSKYFKFFNYKRKHNTSTTKQATASNNTKEKSIWKPTIYSTSPTTKSPGKYKGKVLISYINGIYHSEEDCVDLTEQIKKIFNIDVRAFYYPSTGSWIKDVLKIGGSLFMKSKNDQLALHLANHMKNILMEVGTNGRILHIAHSAGAVITYLAARYHLTLDERNQIDVVTLGGGRSITRKYFKGRIVNYYSSNDPLVIIDNRAGKLHRNRRKGKDNKATFNNATAIAIKGKVKSKSSWFFFSNKEESNHQDINVTLSSQDHDKIATAAYDQSKLAVDAMLEETEISLTSGTSSSVTVTTAAKPIMTSTAGSQHTKDKEEDKYHTYHEMTDDKHNTSFIFIKAIADNPIRDHSLNGPTYQHALYLEAEKLQFRIKQLEIQIARNNSKVRFLRKRFSKWSGVNHFWEKMYNGSLTETAVTVVSKVKILRSSRKISAKLTGYHHFWKNPSKTIQWPSTKNLPWNFPLFPSIHNNSQILLIENSIKTNVMHNKSIHNKGVGSLHNTTKAVEMNKRNDDKQRIDTRNSRALVIYNATYAQQRNNLSLADKSDTSNQTKKSRKSFFVWW